MTCSRRRGPPSTWIRRSTATPTCTGGLLLLREGSGPHHGQLATHRHRSAGVSCPPSTSPRCSRAEHRDLQDRHTRLGGVPHCGDSLQQVDLSLPSCPRPRSRSTDFGLNETEITLHAEAKIAAGARSTSCSCGVTGRTPRRSPTEGCRPICSLPVLGLYAGVDLNLGVKVTTPAPALHRLGDPRRLALAGPQPAGDQHRHRVLRSSAESATLPPGSGPDSNPLRPAHLHSLVAHLRRSGRGRLRRIAGQLGGLLRSAAHHRRPLPSAVVGESGSWSSSPTRARWCGRASSSWTAPPCVRCEFAPRPTARCWSRPPR
jgi:hypothetical protein